MAQINYEQAFRERLGKISPNGDFAAIHLLAEEEAHRLLQEILETGCQSGNYANIGLAHDALSRIPSGWLSEHLPRVAPLCLFQEREWQEWEFRRLAEMLRERFPDSLSWLIRYAKELHNPEVEEAIPDFL